MTKKQNIIDQVELILLEDALYENRGNNKFKLGQQVTHKGNKYLIVKEPDQRLLESTGKSFYEYQCTATGLVWIRGVEEMEDGRFG